MVVTKGKRFKECKFFCQRITKGKVIDFLIGPLDRKALPKRNKFLPSALLGFGLFFSK
jgi:hypothetical protein